jgi:hypothetical protein
MSKFNTESVPTNTLQVGDEFLAHGGLFRVIEVRVSKSHGDSPTPVHANSCEFLGNAFDYECEIPKHWRDGSDDLGNPGLRNYWNQQGNGLARTARIVK